MPIESRNYRNPIQDAQNEQFLEGMKLGSMGRIAGMNDQGKLNMLLMGQNQKNQAHSAQAIAKAQDQYSRGLTKLQDQAQAVSELSDALKNPNQMTLGVTRSLLLKMFGMNRYNEAEAKAVMPPSIYSLFSSASSKAGSDASSLGPDQIRDVQQIAGIVGSGIREKHDVLKHQALSGYSSSPYADPSQLGMLTANLGKPFDNYLDQLNTKMSSNAQASQLAQQPGAAQQTPGLLSGIKKFLLGSQPSTPMNAAMPQQPQGPSPQAQPPAQPAAPSMADQIKAEYLRRGLQP